jgi:hypothetical protein
LFQEKESQMAEMNTRMVGVGRKKSPTVDAGNFAEHIEREANTLAEFGWDHEATHLRKWASELKRRAIRSNYTGDRLPKPAE